MRLCFLNISEDTPVISSTRLCKCDDSGEQAKDDVGNPRKPQSHTENYRQLMKAAGRRAGVPQGRVHQLVLQCQIFSTEEKTHNKVKEQLE